MLRELASTTSGSVFGTLARFGPTRNHNARSKKTVVNATPVLVCPTTRGVKAAFGTVAIPPLL
jgi:hypothetical protein